MIIRIFGEEQYRVPDELEARLQQLDSEVHAAMDAGDEAAFRAKYAELLALVREQGETLAEDDLSQSDLMLPPSDVTLAEARSEFTGEGLIPD